MSVHGKRGIAIPTVLFHEAEGLGIVVETKGGVLYKGYAETTEDNMNLTMYDVHAEYPDGRKHHMKRCYIRGAQIVFIVFPPILQHAPYFERVRKVAAGKSIAVGLGRNRAAAIQSRAMKAPVSSNLGHSQSRGLPPPGMPLGDVPSANPYMQHKPPLSSGYNNNYDRNNSSNSRPFYPALPQRNTFSSSSRPQSQPPNQQYGSRPQSVGRGAAVPHWMQKNANDGNVPGAR